MSTGHELIICGELYKDIDRTALIAELRLCETTDHIRNVLVGTGLSVTEQAKDLTPAEDLIERLSPPKPDMLTLVNSIAATAGVSLASFLPQLTGPVHSVKVTEEQIEGYRQERLRRKAENFAKRTSKKNKKT